MPSTSISVRKPVKPRMNGEPCAWPVFWTSTEGMPSKTSGVVRDARSACTVPASRLCVDAGTSRGLLSSRVAVTTIAGSLFVVCAITEADTPASTIPNNTEGFVITVTSRGMNNFPDANRASRVFK